jgi:hypothetical protein
MLIAVVLSPVAVLGLLLAMQRLEQWVTQADRRYDPRSLR